jgi:penicillin-binding protein 1A
LKRLVKTLAVLAVLSLLGIFTLVGMFFFISTDLPQINSLKDYNPPMNSQILSSDGEVLLDIGKETRDVVPFEKIPPRVVSAFLAAEDDNFYQHEGIDYYGILRAFMVNLKEGRLVQGGSTITQQVAKSFLLSRERTISRKIKDLLLARKIEQKFSKDEILFLYLNQVYLGGGYYGVKAAFKGYFDKELEEATTAEAALVAGLLVAPGRYSPYVNPQYAKRRQNYVLKRLFETRKITQQEYEASLAENIKMRIRTPNELKGGHFTDWVRQEVMRAVGTEEFLINGFRVITTLDWSLQAKAEKAVKDRIKELDKRQGFKGAMRSLKNDQEILDFSLEQRKDIMKEQSSFFTFNTEGKNLYEYNENDEMLKKHLSHFVDEKEKINDRFKNLVEIGNPKSDLFHQFLEVGHSYPAVVIGVDDLKRTILVDIGKSRAIIPDAGFNWAHERKFSESPAYFPPQRTPSKIVKKGDVILVKIEDKLKSSDDLIHADFFKKYKDDGLKKILNKQKFFQASLDQEPEVEGALVALNATTGDIISLVGGVDFQKSQFNRVIQSSRQPGSSFKPFIYAASLENGYNPSSILMDTPQALGGADASLSWKPRNYDGEFRGPMTLRSALEVSRNIPTVRLVQDLGVKRIRDFVGRFHMNSDLPKDMSLALGSFGISLAELAKGYAVFPNGGKAIRLRHITSIQDRNGKSYPLPSADQEWAKGPEVVEPTPMPEPTVVEGDGVELVKPLTNPFLDGLSPVQVYDPRLAYLMTNLLRGVTLYGTGAAASKLSTNLGGKTGTTNNYVDALFVGFSANVVVGAWAGFDDNRPMGYGETGTRAALPIWMDYMQEAIAKYGAPEFKVPDGITNLMVNKETGKPLPAGSQGGFLESFVVGFDPNSEPPVFDQNGQATVAPTTLDDDEYYMNQ